MAWKDNDRKIVSGIFESDIQVESFLSNLEGIGYGTEDVSVMMSDRTRDMYPELVKSNKMPEGATTGAVTGGLLGALIGGLTMAGSVLIPGASLLIAGPIIGAITGGAVGASTGGLIGALVGAGIPEHEAKYYENELKKPGNILVLVHVLDDQADDVKRLFKDNKARNIDVQTEDEGPVEARRDELDRPAYPL